VQLKIIFHPLYTIAVNFRLEMQCNGVKISLSPSIMTILPLSHPLPIRKQAHRRFPVRNSRGAGEQAHPCRTTNPHGARARLVKQAPCATSAELSRLVGAAPSDAAVCACSPSWRAWRLSVECVAAYACSSPRRSGGAQRSAPRCARAARHGGQSAERKAA
jgi:hypothetical protein